VLPGNVHVTLQLWAQGLPQDQWHQFSNNLLLVLRNLFQILLSSIPGYVARIELHGDPPPNDQSPDFFRRKLTPPSFEAADCWPLSLPQEGPTWDIMDTDCPPVGGGGRERGVTGPQRGSAWDIGGQQLGGRMLANYIDGGRGGGEGRRVQGGKLTTPLTTCNSHP